MLNAILSRWARTRPASPTTLGRASDAGAATQRAGSDSFWQSLWRRIPGESDPWGAQAAQAGAAKPFFPSMLPAARAGFEASLAGLQGDGVDELLRSIRRSRSLRDLWHLRTWLYTEVARAHSQYEAEQRLARLGIYFTAPDAMPPRAATKQPQQWN